MGGLLPDLRYTQSAQLSRESPVSRSTSHKGELMHIITIPFYAGTLPNRNLYVWYASQALWQIQLTMRNLAREVRLLERMN